MGRTARRTRAIFTASTRLPLRACPVCRGRLDGDVTTCAHCQALLAFTEDLDLRLATTEEFAQLDPVLQRLAAARWSGAKRYP